jgi:hypothetical protein
MFSLSVAVVLAVAYEQAAVEPEVCCMPLAFIFQPDHRLLLSVLVVRQQRAEP